jgi:hypothetical protein
MNPAIHAAAAAARRRREKEEEQMSGYNPADLEGWEFKIVRSHFARFGNADVLNRLISEESQNGWEMLEKFDNSRIRFKRRIERRSLHSGGEIDPYRTHFGTSPVIMPLVAASVAVLLGAVLFFTNNRAKEDQLATPLIIFGVLALLALVVVIVRKRGT